MNHIVIDLEFNQSSNTKKGKPNASAAECPFEIIQIGAVKLNEKLEKIGEFSFLIKPQIYPKINPIVERITGITDEILKDCPSFQEGYEAFVNFAQGQDSIIYTWGTDDIKSLYRNIKYFKCDINALTKKYINIQPVAAKLLHSTSGGTIGLKNAAELFDINLDLKFHDALNDAYYTSLILQRIYTELPEPSVFKETDIAPKKKTHVKIDTHGLIEYFEQSLERKLTGEETAIILTAYKLGRKHKYEN